MTVPDVFRVTDHRDWRSTNACNQRVKADEKCGAVHSVDLRGQRVMLDADLAALYGVSTRVLDQAVKRNRARFPEDFMSRLTATEKAEVITNCDHLRPLRFSPSLPHAFTEHGAI